MQQVANGWNGGSATGGKTCVEVDVISATPADVAAAIAARNDVAITGLGQPNGNTEVPDVWVPDSTSWLSRLQGASTPVKLAGDSIASSPVVIAVPQPVAKSLSASDKPTWSSLLAVLKSGSVKPGIVDPNGDAAGLSALLAVAGATQSGGHRCRREGRRPSRHRRRHPGTVHGSSQVRDDLLGRFPRSADATALARGLSVAPLPEQAVLAYNSARPPVPLVGLYVSPAPSALDYPYTPVDLTGTKKAAAAKFRPASAAPAGPTCWRRTSCGPPTAPTAPACRPRRTCRSDRCSRPSRRPAAAVDQALSAWSAVTVPGRMLAVIDVSGSMATQVPSAGGASREQVTVAAAKSGLGLFDDAWNVGLWSFSSWMDGSKPYRQLVPIGALSSNRAVMAGALDAVTPIPNAQTGLYDTVLAAYQTVQKNWDPSRVNSVVIMTDGQNENPGGMTMSQLLAAIKKIKDPNKPVEVIAIGIGNERQQERTGQDHRGYRRWRVRHRRPGADRRHLPQGDLAAAGRQQVGSQTNAAAPPFSGDAAVSSSASLCRWRAGQASTPTGVRRAGAPRRTHPVALRSATNDTNGMVPASMIRTVRFSDQPARRARSNASTR